VKRFIVIVCTLLLACGAIIWPASLSFAAPSDADIGVATRKLKALEDQMAASQKSYEDATTRLSQARVEATNNRAELKKLNTSIAADHQALNTQCASLYRMGNTSVLDVIFSSQSFQEVLDRVALLTQMSDHSIDLLNALRSDVSRSMAVQASLDKQVKTQETQTAVLASKTEQIKSGIATQQAFINSLSAQQSAELEAAQLRANKLLAAGATYATAPDTGGAYTGTGFTFKGVASWYDAGYVTANGERFNPNGMTAACLLVRIGTYVRVTYQGRSVVVRINDHGPYVAGRVIDLTRGAAQAIGMQQAGLGQVTCEVVTPAH